MTPSSYSFFSSAPCLISAFYNSSTKAPLKWFMFICVQQYTRSRILASDTGYIGKRKEDLSCPGIFVVWDVISIAEWLGGNTLTIFNGSHNAKFKGQFSAHCYFNAVAHFLSSCDFWMKCSSSFSSTLLFLCLLLGFPLVNWSTGLFLLSVSFSSPFPSLSSTYAQTQGWH